MAGSSDLPHIDAGSMASMVSAILDDCLYNIVSDTILKVHQEEKMARMQSAAVLAQQTKEKAIENAAEDSGAAQVAYTTAGALITETDKIYLLGNPLKTTPEILCPTCRLPRLLYPTTGKNSQPPDAGREYCAKQPYIDKDGCDIYGKSLVVEKSSKKKATKDTKLKPDSPDSDSGSNGKSDKPAATSMPSGKCPNCPRYMAFTRIAQHMDRCLGLSGRQSSKNAMTKMKSGSTPVTSRASTPKPTIVVKKRKLEKDSEDEAEESTLQKKKKVVIKTKDAISKTKAVNSNIQRVKGAEKRPPSQTADGAREGSPLKDKDAEPKKNIPKEEKESD